MSCNCWHQGASEALACAAALQPDPAPAPCHAGCAAAETSHRDPAFPLQTGERARVGGKGLVLRCGWLRVWGSWFWGGYQPAWVCVEGVHEDSASLSGFAEAEVATPQPKGWGWWDGGHQALLFHTAHRFGSKYFPNNITKPKAFCKPETSQHDLPGRVLLAGMGGLGTLEGTGGHWAGCWVLSSPALARALPLHSSLRADIDIETTSLHGRWERLSFDRQREAKKKRRKKPVTSCQSSEAGQF